MFIQDEGRRRVKCTVIHGWLYGAAAGFFKTKASLEMQHKRTDWKVRRKI